jgi:TolB-like protein/Tfp pilus assembly protein PilF
MASIIPGYEYDIFISYRQKDNKGDIWVSRFVETLKTELEATFKEDVSVYFDENPHDRLQETHNVDKSLEGKLKCLIFIPILSKTYCDPNSYAWQYEFLTFLKMAENDHFGRDIKLRSGNVASRVLPIRIHDLEPEDIKLFEKETGSVLRAMDFVFKTTSGVNRPLKANEDHPHDNTYKTFYSDQINKVANAIDEVIHSLKKIEPIHADRILLSDQPYHDTDGDKSKELSRTAIIIKRSNKWLILIISVLFCVVGTFAVFKIILARKTAGEVAILEKSIAVLPFVNINNDPEQEYFSDGIMQEILNHLFKIGGLKIPSSTSSMRFKGTKLSVREVAQELKVSYVLEGNVSKSGDNVRIIVRLINGKNEQVLWTENYNRAMTAINLLEIQSDVAQQVADNMKVVINPEVRQRIEAKPTVNTEAYTLFLRAWNQYTPFNQAKPILERAISLDPKYADAYALLGYYWVNEGGHGGNLKREKVLENAEPLIEKSLQLDKNSLLAHLVKSSLRLYYYWDFASVEKEFQICTQLIPSNSELAGGFSDYLLASGKFSESFILTKNALDQDKNSILNWVQMALSYYYEGQQEKAFETIETARHLFPENDSLNYYLFTNSIRLLVYMAKYDKAIGLFERSTQDEEINDLIPYYLGHLGIAYFKTGKKSKSALFLNELLKRSSKSPLGSPSFFAAAIYTAMGENDKALQSLEKAYSDHEVEMYWLKVEPLFRPLHGDPRFEDLLLKIGFK